MTTHQPNCEDATGAYPGSCTCKVNDMDELTEELARAIMMNRENGGCIVKDWQKEAKDNSHVAQALHQAQAILPIIRRRELEAGEKVKEAVMPYIEDIAALTENPTYDPLEVGFRHSQLTQQEIRDRYARACAMVWQDTQNAIRALDIPAIIGDKHD